MDAKAQDDWKGMLAEGETVALTHKNVELVFRKLYGSLGEMFERSIIQCFQRLSWNRRADAPRQIGKKFIQPYLLRESGTANRDQSEELEMLMRIFHVLDGIPEKVHESRLQAAIYDAHQAGKDLKNDYIQIRLFQNGNGHVTFLRPDLVGKMNEVILKRFPKALPPTK
ncbi:MAG: DUF4942 domain-containing protein [Betaproteobacteria bacterium]|nr:DUF4942 domain-containing protein [Betaproteobacteria bacterium]